MRPTRRVRDDQGAAVVEMALVAPILFLLIFGIIAFGYAMSVQQNLRQAAAEGARAAAVAPYSAGFTEARDAAEFATEKAVGEFGKNCLSHVSCEYINAPCSQAENASVNVLPVAGELQCMKVAISLDTSDEWFANIPLIGSAMPESLDAQSVIEINQ